MLRTICAIYRRQPRRLDPVSSTTSQHEHGAEQQHHPQDQRGWERRKFQAPVSDRGVGATRKPLTSSD